MQTCLQLTHGQFLDLDFEKRQTVNLPEYLEMISGKTNSLITTCLQIGAILGNPDAQVQQNFAKYGHHLGMAFQIVDDYLGIWGKSDITGKSSASDLISRKKTYPVVLGLASIPEFRDMWEKSELSETDADSMADLLIYHGIQEKTLAAANEFSQNALSDLRLACIHQSSFEMMQHLTSWLVFRDL